VTQPPQPRLPLHTVLLTALQLPTRPAWAIQRLDPDSPHAPRCNLRTAFAVHLLWAAVGWIVGCACIALAELNGEQGVLVWLRRWAQHIGMPLSELADAFRDNAVLATGLVMLNVLIYVVLTLGLAVLSLSWVPHGETWLDRLMTALRRWWLLGGVGLWVVLLFLLPSSALTYYSTLWWAEHGPQDYDWNSQPWLLRHRFELGFACFLLAAFVVLWLVHRGLSVGSAKACCLWPPRCQRCGYGLFGMTATQDCPECGAPVREAISNQRDQPARDLWDHPNPLVRGWRLVIWPIYHYDQWGRRLRRLEPDPAWKHILPLHALSAVPLGLALGLGTAGFMMVFNAYRYGANTATFYWEHVWMGLSFGSLWAIAMSIGTVWVTTSFGVMATWFFKRDLLPAAAQSGAYLGGLANFGFVAIWLAVLAIVVLDDTGYLRDLADVLDLDDMLLYIAVLVIFTGPVIYRYVWCLSKMTLAMRYANR